MIGRDGHIDLRPDGERCREDLEDEADRERGAHELHAATGGRLLSTAAIFRQPSILRNLVCPLATRLKKTGTKRL